jgi:glycerophosphoryl diester phosphodiesterase
VLEFKSDFNKEEIIEIINIIKNLEYLNGVIFISFDYNQLLTVREILPTQPVMYLAHTVSEDAVLRLLWDRVDLSIGHASLTKDLLDRFHSAGLKVSVWTVNDKAKAERLADMGVDYITTDILE